MGREGKAVEADEPASAPEWMVTFSDCMTLLLTFFVLLVTFSSFDELVFRKLKVIFSNSLSSVSRPDKKDRDSFLPVQQIEPTAELGQGSEKPTLAKGWEDNLKEETESVDFHKRKVFLIPSKRIFWGKGTAISSEGRDIMSTMATFLREVPSRVVISENGPVTNEDIKKFGLLRAWVVMEHLTMKQGLDKKKFSISASSTVDQKGFKDSGKGRARPESERMLEIVLLERSIYN
jgi:chemotaxis protein MotB